MLTHHISSIVSFLLLRSCDSFVPASLAGRKGISLFSQSDSESAPSPSPFEPNSHDELMYVLGINLARQIGDINPLVDNKSELSIVAQGLLDVVTGKLSEEEQAMILKTRGKDLSTMITSRAEKLRKNMEETGASLLDEMGATEGATTLASGVVVHPLEAGPEGFGSGMRPTTASSVQIHYHGTLSDGTTFDSSLDGEPAKFALNQVIPGLKEALQKMHEGETAMIGIAPNMGYANEGSPDGRIPGGATLFFKVVLIKVLTAGIGGGPTLLGADGTPMKGGESSGSNFLLGPDGKPL